MKRVLKRALTVLLCIVMVLSSVPFCFAADDELKIVVASDLHIESSAGYGDMTSNSSFDASNPFYHATIQGQMGAESEAIVSAFLKKFTASEEKILLIAGDLTNGNKLDHALLASMLGDAEKAGKRVFVINGNHDIDSGREDRFTTAEEFKACYADFGYSEALCVDESSASYTAELDGAYRLLALDSCVYGEDAGEIGADKLQWISEQVEQANKDKKVLVTMMHHSILTHFPLQDIIENYMELSAKFADMGLKYVFTGHMHANDIAEAVSDNGNRIYDIMTGSLITYPCAYRHVSFNSESVDISTDYITEIDTALLPKGYTATQLKMISSDFSGYAYGFLEAGMKNWIDKRLGSEDRVSRLLKIEQGTKAYEALDSVMGILGEALNLPLYNTEKTPEAFDSVEEIIACYGYTLPESDYEYAYQLVGAIMGGFFAGDEHYTADSPEIKIMFSVVPGGLTYAMCRLASFKNDELTASLFKAFDAGSAIRSSSLRKSVNKCVDSIVAAILVPVLEGICDDAYTPSDLNVSLEGWEAANPAGDSTVPLTQIKRITEYLRDFFRVLIQYLFG